MTAIEELIRMIEEATQSLPGRVTPDTELASVDGWDSMGLVSFVGLVQDAVRVELSVHELRACATPAEVLALVQGSPAA